MLKRCGPLACLGVAALLIVAADGEAQVGKVGYYNPYTGRASTATAGYNPYTGTSAASRTNYNPYTGNSSKAAAAYNPYTGSSFKGASTYNPYTGTGSYRYSRQTSGKVHVVVPR